VFGAAGCDTVTVFAAKANGNFEEGRYHRDTLGMVNDLVGNRMVRSRHYLRQDVSGFVNALLDSGFVVVIGRPAHANDDQNCGGQSQQLFRGFHH
jgi:hypothetical protein